MLHVVVILEILGVGVVNVEVLYLAIACGCLFSEEMFCSSLAACYVVIGVCVTFGTLQTPLLFLAMNYAD